MDKQMNNLNRKSSTIASGKRYSKMNALARKATAVSVAGLLSTAAFAEDVEIYLDNNSLSVNPNLLFVIDTSGSMGGEVSLSTYDPATTYAVPGGSPACDASRLYVGGIDGVTHPGCDTEYWFAKNQFRCGAAEGNLAIGAANAGQGTGFYLDKFAQWDTAYRGWYNLDSYFDNYRNQSAHYECEDDYGDHGENATDPRTRVRNGNTYPWSTAFNYSIWNSKGTRTVYTANYLNWYHYNGGSSGVTKTRLEVVVDAAKDLIDSVADMNVGIMRFDNTGTVYNPTDVGGNRTNNHGGPVSRGTLDISPGETTGGVSNKQILKNTLDGFTFQGSTPLTETVYEGMRYMRGDNVFYGLPQADGNLTSHSSSRTGNTYNSPMEFDCQENYMVVFSDGRPTADHDADPAINTLISGTSGDMGSCNHGSTTYLAEDSCLDELSNFMFNADHASTATGNNLAGKQRITSYYISGFDSADDTLMQSAAEKGGTQQFYSASNPSQFAAVFNTIISEIQQFNASFTSPAVSVNALNRLKNNNELYFALFEPDRKPHWNGNIKKYELGPDISGAVDADGEPVLQIVDANGVNAVNPTTGLFESSAQSFWQLSGQGPDGDKTSEGGAAHRQFDYDASATEYDASSRTTVFTSLTEYAPNAIEFDGSGIGLTAISDSLVDLGPLNSPLLENGTNVTSGTLGFPTPILSAEVLKRLQWIRGVDVLDEDGDGSITDGRPVMGGILHNEPVLVNYGIDDNGTPADESDDEQINAILATTNDGFFHIFNTVDSGNSRLEHSAVIPKKTLKQMEQLYINGGADIAYRLDSNIDVWRNDANKDDQITTGGNDFVYAYFGQRRGGNAIFAYDITDVTNPKLLWEIDPDVIDPAETDSSLAPFLRMGESWSRPRKHRILVANSAGTDLEARSVLVFGGGYDSTRDDVEDIARDEDGLGNAIYMVDATTGELIWWAGKNAINGVSPNSTLADMKYGFPSNLRIVDVNGDTIADKIFASDGGGQVWRFDINNNLNVGQSFGLNSRFTGGVVADLQLADDSDTAIDSNNRRLYYAPDVAIIQENETDAPQLSIAIGSGYRAHPLNKTINDKFFLLKYEDVLSAPTGSGGLDGYQTTKLYVNDLLDITTLNFADQTVVDTLATADRTRIDENGWFLNLTDDGEKSLSESITVAGFVVFTTYTPPGQGSNSSGQECSGNQGVSKTYVVSAFDGAPVANLDGVGAEDSLETTDRVFNNRVPGIAPEPKTVFPDIEGVDSGRIIVGREILPLKIENRPDLTYWIQE